MEMNMNHVFARLNDDERKELTKRIIQDAAKSVAFQVSAYLYKMQKVFKPKKDDAQPITDVLENKVDESATT